MYLELIHLVLLKEACRFAPRELYLSNSYTITRLYDFRAISEQFTLKLTTNVS